MSGTPSPPTSDSTVVMSPTAWKIFQDWVNKNYGTNSSISALGDTSVSFSADTNSLLQDWLSTGATSKSIAPLGGTNPSGASKSKAKTAPGAASIGHKILDVAVLASILVVIFASVSLMGGKGMS